MPESTASNPTIVITENMIREEIRNVVMAHITGQQMVTGIVFRDEVKNALQPIVVDAVKAQMRLIFQTLGYSGQF